jgi:hypothetical protein
LKILKYEGVAGLYAGVGTSLVGTVLQNFVYFYAYGMIRGGYLKRKANQDISTIMELFLGAISGATTQFIALPLAVITTRQQTLPKTEQTPFLHTISNIIKEDGYGGFWRGLQASLVLCVNPAITYGLFERIKRIREKSGKLTAGDAFVIGALAKTLATVVTYPYIMAKVRLQYKPSKQIYTTHELSSLEYKGALDVLNKVYRSNGVRGWYKGMETQVGKAVLCQAVLFVSKEKFSVLTVWLMGLLKRQRVNC